MKGQGFWGAPWPMLLLKPDRSAIIRMNPGGRSQVDFDTVACETLLADASVELETKPNQAGISSLAGNPEERVQVRSLREQLSLTTINMPQLA
jgi:RecB family endonuclease NucS